MIFDDWVQMIFWNIIKIGSIVQMHVIRNVIQNLRVQQQKTDTESHYFSS